MTPLHCTNCQKTTNRLHPVSWHFSPEAEMLGSNPEPQRWWHIHDNRLCAICYDDLMGYPLNRHSLYKKLMEQNPRKDGD